MKNLITIRDTVKEFLSKYDRFIIPVLKFFVMLLVMMSFKKIMGYSDDMSGGGLMALVSLICAFLPVQLIVLIAGAVGLVHMYSVSLEVAALYLVLFVLMYLLYLRFAPKYGWLVIIMPMFYIIKLHYIVPILVGIFVGPVGIVPAAFGVVFYYFAGEVADYNSLLQMASEEEALQGFNYILRGLLENKEMLLTIVVFAFVIAATYIIYRQSFKYSWIVAIGSGGILSIVLFLMGGIVLEAETNMGAIFLGSLVGVAIAVVAQFFKSFLDYSRVEIVQFEDDEYYYYVKAVPKIRMEKQNIKVKKITDTDEEIDQYMEVHEEARSVSTSTLRERAAQIRNQGSTKVTASGRVAQKQQETAQRRQQAQAAAQGTARQQVNPQQRVQGAGRQQAAPQNTTQTRVPGGAQTYTNAQRQAQRQVYNNTRTQAQRTNMRPGGPGAPMNNSGMNGANPNQNSPR